MKQVLKTVFLVFVSLIISLNVSAATFQAPESFADLVDQLSPAVVNISTTSIVQDSQPMMPFPENSPFSEFFRNFNGLQQGKPKTKRVMSLGSGFIIDAKKGYIVTNYHVIKNADEVIVVLSDDTEIEAKVVGFDDRTDVALLKIKTDAPLQEVKFGNSDNVRVGDWVLAIGNPFGLGGTVTAGIVSARARDISANVYVDYIQSDVSINRGNSGGPMFNMNGEVIGINTVIFSPNGGSVGVGFAVPSSDAITIVKQIEEFGQPKRGWIGIAVQEVSKEIGEALGLKNDYGALVLSVTPEGPADKSGLKTSDIIIEFNGKQIKHMREIPRIVGNTPINKVVPYVVWRKGKKVKLNVKVGEFKNELAGKDVSRLDNNPVTKEVVVKELGIAVRNLSDELKKKLRVDIADKGVVISKLTPQSPFVREGLRPGDVIIELNQEPVENIETFVRLIKQVLKSNTDSILLLVNRHGNKSFVVLPLKEKK